MKRIIFFWEIITCTVCLNAMQDQEMRPYAFDFFPENQEELRGDEALEDLLSRIDWNYTARFLDYAHLLLRIGDLSSAGLRNQHENLSRLLCSGYYNELFINNPDLTDPLRSTLMHKATRLGSIPLCELLIANGASIASVDFLNRTPLHYAVIGRNEALLEFFAHFLTDPRYWLAINQQDNCQRTVLHYAYEYALPKAIAVLIDKGARNDIRDWQGNIPSACASIIWDHDSFDDCIRLLQETKL